MTDKKPNSWPKFVWVLFALSILISCAVLVSLGWYGLTGSGFSQDFPTWLPGIAAGLTLVCTIVNISSTNPNTYEIIIPDAIQITLWAATIIRMALFITDNNAFGSCAQVASIFRSTCTVSQLVLWCGVALINVSLAKLVTAIYVRRAARGSQKPDCEKQPVLQPLQ